MRIKELNKIITEDEEKREKLIEKLKEIEPAEKFNDNGITFESSLSIKAVEARGLVTASMTGGMNPYVQGVVNNNKEHTEVAQGTNDPVWQDVMEFDISTGYEQPIV